jgi:photosystem II stability/assembly factor-like uncharacterized protein
MIGVPEEIRVGTYYILGYFVWINCGKPSLYRHKRVDMLGFRSSGLHCHILPTEYGTSCSLPYSPVVVCAIDVSLGGIRRLHPPRLTFISARYAAGRRRVSLLSFLHMRKLTLAALLLTTTAQAQFQIQDSHTTASLRGIHSIGNGIAWASGTEGTVLRTTDEGATWQRCTTPPDANKLDFRGIQAFDKNTAIVMSSGKGDLSRLYKTTDGCQTWKSGTINPAKEGFWDAFHMNDLNHGYLLGDPVNDMFVLGDTSQGAEAFVDSVPSVDFYNKTGFGAPSLGRSAFAASNSSIASPPRSEIPNLKGLENHPCSFARQWFGTSGPGGSLVYRLQEDLPQCLDYGTEKWIATAVPIEGANAHSGVFSLAFRSYYVGNAVGGDYQKPTATAATSAFTEDGGQTWTAALTPPHGYRSSVVYDSTTKTWITVGPNGTDISRDDGKNWTALRSTPQDQPDADKNWNALSLPFVVGPHGRIGKLRPEALKP